jgi:hypothetical protein
MIQISLADISNIFFSGELKQFEENNRRKSYSTLQTTIHWLDYQGK